MKNLLIGLLLSIIGTTSVFAEVCDINEDGAINKLDLAMISKSRGQVPYYLDPRDSNLDGKISPADVMVCIKLCDLANCAIN